ncbi:ABC transporter ATP-binding protein [Streptomyces sp. MA5143a]|uniref:ABC transporter ATP-binding protein n=1 Tax=Streptomyces sp. MA5143a TaxID=2083010 RepID=UPI000D1A09D3|nr:ABC transporter ATP-binding protein [Streptomyces sp. MA5143a]SPF04965.1 Lipid A export ATP-binding/permease protein MsbA [Streptomyces sp. MA5143a]
MTTLTEPGGHAEQGGHGPAATSTDPATARASGTSPASPASDALLSATVRYSARRCAALALVALATTGANLVLPVALGRALDLLLTADPAATRWVLWCAALMLLLAVLDAVETVVGGTTSARATAWLRRRLTGHVLAVGPRAVARSGPGDLVARLVGNAAQAGTAPATVAALLAALAGPVGAVVALALIDPWLAGVFLVGAPVLALLLRCLARDSTACVTRYQELQGRIAGGLAEAVAGARTIAAAGTADRTVARVLRPLPELSREGHRMWRVQGRAAAQAAAVAPLLQIGVLATAGALLARRQVSVGELLAASRYAVLAAGVGVLVGQLSGLVRSRAAARRLDEVLAEPPLGYGERRLPPSGCGRLELRGVTVRRGARAVLDGVDLVVPAGTTLAVVGRSGAGKSLLAAVAGRLVDPDEGEVRLDGVPLRALDRRELRAAITHAFERPALLGDSIEDTIALGVSRPSPGRVRRAAGAARADVFIDRLPHGYATRCAEAPMSGGEAQRLGLARAFARTPRLLVLDDALSSLDTITEHHVTAALLHSTPARTRLLITHRPTTAADADRVVWLDGGRVRATGTHKELWRLPGYRELFGAGDEGSVGAGGGVRGVRNAGRAGEGNASSRVCEPPFPAGGGS